MSCPIEQIIVFHKTELTDGSNSTAIAALLKNKSNFRK
jgi:hypothetical protein